MPCLVSHPLLCHADCCALCCSSFAQCSSNRHVAIYGQYVPSASASGTLLRHVLCLMLACALDLREQRHGLYAQAGSEPDRYCERRVSQAIPQFTAAEPWSCRSF